jgi:hypothetical protein
MVIAVEPLVTDAVVVTVGNAPTFPVKPTIPPATNCAVLSHVI